MAGSFKIQQGPSGGIIPEANFTTIYASDVDNKIWVVPPNGEEYSIGSGATGADGSNGATGSTGSTTSVNSVEELDGDIAITLDEIPDGILFQKYTNEKARIAGYNSGTTFPLSPGDYQKFFRTDSGIMFYWDTSRSEWLSENTRACNFTLDITTSSLTSIILNCGEIDREYVLSQWKLVGIIVGNDNLSATGQVDVLDSTGSSRHTESYTGASNNFNIDANMQANTFLQVQLTPLSLGVTKPAVTLMLKYRG